MAVVDGFALLEDFTRIDGSLLVLSDKAGPQELRKSAEPTWPDTNDLYLGHTLEEVLEAHHDLLGSEILASPGDPDYGQVAACLPRIRRMETFSFVGAAGNSDKVGVSYGGRTANFDPAILVPSVKEIREQGGVLHGLLGDWLPALRFVYPESDGDWTEMILFGPERVDCQNTKVQPVWYRVCRIEAGELRWAKYFDSYVPFPPRTSTEDAADFYRDLIVLRDRWEEAIGTSTRVDISDQRLANQARHSLVRAAITRIDGFPKYGVLDRNYGGSEHDGFQDTFNTEATAMLQWRLFHTARDIIENYFAHFVREDGSILYRGPQVGQYGRMLATLALYWNYTRDSALLAAHKGKIEKIAALLLSLRHQAKEIPEDDPARGMIHGWCEADSCLEPDPSRYLRPYYSNTTEAIRGLTDLSAVWRQAGFGELCSEIESMRSDLETSIARSTLTDCDPACIPAIAGADVPFDVASREDSLDPQFRAYRAYSEMLHSGCLTLAQVETIVRYREAHGDIRLGIPCVYGFKSNELGGFLSYGHAYGLLQHDLIREFLLLLYSLSAHQYSRGCWTAPETRLIDSERSAAPYCVPAQLAVPLLLRWMLVFEEPFAETLWLCKATPREWLQDGKEISVTDASTRWGNVSFRIRRTAAQVTVIAEVPRGARTVLRLRLPLGRQIKAAIVNETEWSHIDLDGETIELPPGRVDMVASLL